MPKKPEIALPASRYSYARVSAEIERELVKRGRGAKKQAAAAAMVTASQLSKRLLGLERFSIEQIGLIADWLNAPPGWPFVQWAEAQEMAEVFEASRNKRR